MYQISPLSREEKLKDPQYKAKYDIVQDMYSRLEPKLLQDEEILNYLIILKVNNLLEDDKDEKKDIMTYYKYMLGEFIINKDENKELKDKLVSQIQENYSNEFLNLCMYMYKTMEYNEVEDYLYLHAKIIYLIDKYKGTQFSIDMLKYFNTINHYEDYNPHLSKEDLESITDFKEKEEAYKKVNSYLTLNLDYMRINSCFSKYLSDREYSKDSLRIEAERFLLDYFYLEHYDIILTINEESEKDILNPLRITFKSYVKDSKEIYRLREKTEEFLKDKAEEYNIDITLSKEEQKIVKDKLEKAKEVIGKYNCKALDYINFNTTTQLLSDNKDTIEWLKDNNTDLSLINLENKKKKVKQYNETDTPQKQHKPITKPKKKITPNRATKEELDAIYKSKQKEFYKTGSIATNTTIFNTYGALGSLETSTKEKVELKITDTEKALLKAKTEDDKEKYKGELELLKNKRDTLIKQEEEMLKTISEKKANLSEVKSNLQRQEMQGNLTNNEKEQYITLINSLTTDIMEDEHDLEQFNNKGIVFRGNLFNELEYIDDKGRTIASLRKSNGDILDPKEVPTLTEVFLRISNDLFYNRQKNYNEFIDKIDLLFPKNKGTQYRIANETIKRNLGKNGFIIDLKELLKLLDVSEDIKYYSKNVSEAIKFLYNVEISVRNEDKLLKDKDILNMFFGLTSNTLVSRQVNNNVYIYYEISSPYETILANGNNPLIAKTPTKLLKYATGQDGKKRVFKLGDYLYFNLRNSLNNSNNGIKLNKEGQYYKNYKIGTLLNHLRRRGVLKKEARPRKYREDIFNNFVKALDTLEEDGIIKYNILYDDSVPMTNEVFKYTFENSYITITFLIVSEDYDNILSKNISNKKGANITNASNFIITFGKYEGKTIKEVYEIDKSYLEYILNNIDIKIKKPKITRQHIKNYLKYQENLESLKDK